MSYKKTWSHESVNLLLKKHKAHDPVTLVKEISRKLVLTAMDKGWSGPPFRALDMARLLDIETVPNDSIFDARIVFKNDKFYIEYNPFQKPTRLNFSIAHEIAHTFFPDCSQTVRNREQHPVENKELEQLCNIAASELQLPYAYFSNDANSIEHITIENLTELATKYKASLESLFLRFVEVTDSKCAIIISQFSEKSKKLTVEYYKASRNFDSIIPRDFNLPEESKAYECLTPGWTARETVKWEFLDEKHDIYCIGLSPLRNSNLGRVGIVITPKTGIEDLQKNKIQVEFGDATKPRGKGKIIIAQVVNTSGALGRGFGKSLSKNFPSVKTEMDRWKKNKKEFVLGNTNLVQINKSLYVFQMLAQEGIFPRDNIVPLKYKSLRKCLQELSITAKELNASIHMPLIGAGQARGDWKIISGMIHDELVANNIRVNIYILPGKSIPLNDKSNIIDFNIKSTWQQGNLF